MTPHMLTLASHTCRWCQNYRKLQHVSFIQHWLSVEKDVLHCLIATDALHGNFFCCRIVVMRLKKKNLHIRRGAIGCCFTLFFFHQRINIFAEAVHCVASLELVLKSTHIFKEATDPVETKWEKANHEFGKKRVVGKAGTGLLLRAKLLFWWVSFFSKTPLLKKGKDDGNCLV